MQDFYAKIYTLIGKNKKVFYVGCTILDVEERLRQHITEARSFEGFTKMPQRSRVIRENDFDVTATIIDIVTITAKDGKEAKFKAEPFEIVWIRKFLDTGANLANRRNVTSKTKREQFIGKTVKAA